MANIFPKSVNWLPVQVLIALGSLVPLVVIGMWYYFTPKYTRVGYMPEQPIAFSHKLHAGQLGMDCRYCHSFVDQAAHSNIPTSQTCNNCHKQGGVQWDSPKLAQLRESLEKDQPIRWVRIHQTPDYVYFNHSAHVNRGISCYSCHGQINEMEVVYQAESQSMGWCLDCHRNPENYIRPLDEVYNLDWTIADAVNKGEFDFTPNKQGQITAHAAQRELGEHLVKAWNVHPPENCAGCHR